MIKLFALTSQYLDFIHPLEVSSIKLAISVKDYIFTYEQELEFIIILIQFQHFICQLFIPRKFAVFLSDFSARLLQRNVLWSSTHGTLYLTILEHLEKYKTLSQVYTELPGNILK